MVIVNFVQVWVKYMIVGYSDKKDFCSGIRAYSSGFTASALEGFQVWRLGSPVLSEEGSRVVLNIVGPFRS